MIDFELYNKTVLKRLKSLSNITILLGAGNKEKRANKFTLSITLDYDKIDVTCYQPMSLCGDFNSNVFWFYVNAVANNKVSKIVFDVSTAKFIKWSQNIIQYLHTMLASCGEIYIDQSVCFRFYVPCKILDKNYDNVIEKGKKKILLAREGYVTSGFLDTYDMNEYILPTNLDIINHNANMFKQAGFITNIYSDGKYPVMEHPLYVYNVEYLICKKID